MDPLHDLVHSINIAPVDNTQLTHSEINIEVVSSSIAPASTPIPSPCESTSETEEFYDPYDFNIIIVESDEETDTVSSVVDQLSNSRIHHCGDETLHSTMISPMTIFLFSLATLRLESLPISNEPFKLHIPLLGM